MARRGVDGPETLTVPPREGLAMTDEARTHDHEPSAVALTDPATRAYWARRFQVPVETLQEAVDAVGTDPKTVAARLGRPWPFEGSGIV